MAFTPPFPERPARRLPLPELLRRARRSFLEVWLDPHFEQAVIPTRVLARRILVCNSPASVQEAFIDKAPALERKKVRRCAMRWSRCWATGFSSRTGWSGRSDAVWWPG